VKRKYPAWVELHPFGETLPYAHNRITVDDSKPDRYGLPMEQPLPWCARFMRWCFERAGTPLPGNRWLIASVEEMQHALAARGAILGSDQAPKPGDLVFLRHRGASDAGAGHHVGIVETVTPTNIGSIDGNWRDAVRRVDRKRDDPAIWCFARWPIRPAA